MNLQRPPLGPLRPFVKWLWSSDEGHVEAARERIVPTGTMHVVIRLSDEPVRIYPEVDAPLAEAIGTATISGARARYYVKDTAQPSCSVGAVLEPAASLPLLGVPASELAGRHTSLVDLWGPRVAEVRDRLRALASPHDRLALFEAELARRLPRVRGVHPAIAHAIVGLAGDAGVGEIGEESGYSHRWLVTEFRRAVGLAPKAYSRIVRLQRVLRAHRESRAAWSALAVAGGYSDQAHLTRELREIAGVTPSELARLGPRHDNHIPIATSDSFKTIARRGGKLAP